MFFKTHKKLTVIIAALLVLAIIAAISIIVVANRDFRKASWGMTQEQVIRSEGSEPLDQTVSSLSYRLASIEGVDYDTVFFYRFDGETKGLWQVSLGVRTNGYDTKLAKRITKAFEEKYGEPDKYEETEGSYSSWWYDGRTEIYTGQIENYIYITYTDIDYAEK